MPLASFALPLPCPAVRSRSRRRRQQGAYWDHVEIHLCPRVLGSFELLLQIGPAVCVSGWLHRPQAMREVYKSEFIEVDAKMCKRQRRAASSETPLAVRQHESSCDEGFSQASLVPLSDTKERRPQGRGNRSSSRVASASTSCESSKACLTTTAGVDNMLHAELGVEGVIVVCDKLDEQSQSETRNDVCASKSESDSAPLLSLCFSLDFCQSRLHLSLAPIHITCFSDTYITA